MIYRYQWLGGFSSDDLPLASGVIATVSPPAPVPVVDIDLSSASAQDKADLDDAMSALGWSFVTSSPMVHPPQGIVHRQTQFTELTLDATTLSTVFVDLLSKTVITDEGGALEILASTSSTSIAAGAFFRLTLDGIAIAQGGAGHLIGNAGDAIFKRISVAPGPHTIALQWRTGLAGTLFIRPTTVPEAESASLLIKEFSS